MCCHQQLYTPCSLTRVICYGTFADPAIVDYRLCQTNFRYARWFDYRLWQTNGCLLIIVSSVLRKQPVTAVDGIRNSVHDGECRAISPLRHLTLSRGRKSPGFGEKINHGLLELFRELFTLLQKYHVECVPHFQISLTAHYYFFKFRRLSLRFCMFISVEIFRFF